MVISQQTEIIDIIMKYIQYVTILHQFTIIYEKNKHLELKKPLFGMKYNIIMQN